MGESVAERSLEWGPARHARQLIGDRVGDFLQGWPRGDEVEVAAIDGALSDTAAFCAAYGVSLEESANCVVVAGKRAGEPRYAACLVRATDRADVNGVVRRLLDVRKASFLPMEDAVRLTGMEYGGITALGLPADWRILVDGGVADQPALVVGSGIRASKLRLSGAALLALPNAERVDDLARIAQLGHG
jgi:prolyl-tRNA editing enzyme YbaK/EbsC (Cys-tRNA(Pro) deacylase)